MSVNGVTNGVDSSSYSAYSSQNVKSNSSTTASTETAASQSSNNSGVIYEPSADAAKAAATKKYQPDAELIAKLKADSDARVSQMKSLVQQMMNQQTNQYGKANDIWSFLSKGDFTVDAATKARAQADIADDGYWGVSQTSQRILDFAGALTGGDPSKIESMRSAFEKGFKAAEKTWGGKLPDISYKTYDAVMKGFDKLKTDSGMAN